MIDANFIDRILALAPTEQIEIDGRKFTDSKIFPVAAPEAAPIAVHTLTGLVDFYDTLTREQQENAIFHVSDYDNVSIVSDLFGAEKQRETFIVAKAYPLKDRFDEYIDHENFMIWILSMFVQDEATAKVLRIVGNLKSEAGATYSDDGLTQTVTAKTGITKVENIELPNPISLRPYRTFMDIEQPESKFILRLKQGGDAHPYVALYEADGGAWKNTAIATIKAYLESRKIGAKIVA